MRVHNTSRRCAWGLVLGVLVPGSALATPPGKPPLARDTGQLASDLDTAHTNAPHHAPPVRPHDGAPTALPRGGGPIDTNCVGADEARGDCAAPDLAPTAPQRGATGTPMREPAPMQQNAPGPVPSAGQITPVP